MARSVNRPRFDGVNRKAHAMVGAGLALCLPVLGCAPESTSEEPAPAPPTMAGNQTLHPVAIPATVPERLRVEVLETQPHDPAAFTQGLLVHQGYLYESTGLYGRSQLRRIGPNGGLVEKKVALPEMFFAEGLERVGDRLLQLTWKAGVVRSYDIETFDVVEERGYAGEGWGLAYDGRRLIMSDSTATLTFRDPATFNVLGHLPVTNQGRPVPQVNELEFVEGVLYANVWGKDDLLRIDLETGHVTAVIDASDLLTPVERRRVDVLNGIAYDPASASFWITGKMWPKMFRVRFVPVE